MDLEEEGKDGAVGGARRVEDDLDRLRVTRMVAVGGVIVVPAGVADAGRDDARLAPDQVLHPPEAAAGKHGRLEAVALGDGSVVGHGVPPGQRTLRPAR